MKFLVWMALLMASNIVTLANDTPVGLALLRSEPWSPPTQISQAVPFVSTEDHTGYFTLTLPDGTREKIDRGLIVQWVTIPSTTFYTDIVTEQELQPLIQELNQLLAVSAKVTETKPLLRPPIADFQAEIELFRKGNKKVSGRWMSGTAYKQMQANALAEQVKEESDQARDQANREANTAANDLKSAPDLSTSEDAIAKLSALEKTSPTAVQIVAEWTREETTVSDWRAEEVHTIDNIQSHRTAPFFDTFPTVSAFSEVSPEIQRSAASLDAAFQKMKGTMQFPQILKKVDREYQTVCCIEDITSVLASAKQQDIAGSLSKLTDALNAHSLADPIIIKALTEIKKPLQAVVDEAQQYQLEAKKFEDAGKTSEAIEAYQRSYDLIKNDDLLKKIKELRDQSLGL
ncbi:MAG TPA: hypothetical protein VHY22_07830 [Chthoniobacteraceae bacterium]|jgi:hypothetical protein|nr:hypothetical protein [Chthoniobacteraceae bacterium]